MLLGIYRSYDDLEECLSVDELTRMIAANRKRQNEDRRFAAALKGVKLATPEEEQDKELRESVRRRAHARLKGIPLEEMDDKLSVTNFIRMESD